MATAQHIINRAYSKIGIKAAETPLEAAEVQDGLDCLNDMVAEWDAVGFLKGVSPVKLASDIVIAPRYAEGALKNMLAIRLANEYNKPITPGMVAAAETSYNNIIKITVNFDNVKLPGNLPTGSGNKTRGYGDWYEFYATNLKPNF
jgi:hypothetical protein